MLSNTYALAVAIAAILLASCSDNDSPDPFVGGNNGGAVVPVEQRLRQIDNSDDFYAALREGLVRQWANTQDVYALESPQPQVPETDSGATADAAAAPQAEGSLTTSNDNDVTGTNVQEAGVDEADRIKTDGQHLFVLDSRFGGEYPLIEPEGVVEQELPDVEIENRTSVLAPGNFTTSLRILSLQPDAPDATSVRDLEIDLGGRNASGMYLYSATDRQSVILTSSGFNDYWSYWGDPYAFGGLSSEITEVDVTDPAQAEVADQFFIDGQIISSRRIGQYLFLASRYYPQIPGVDVYSQTPEELQAQIQATDLSTLLPQYTRGSDGEAQSLVDPSGCFVAESPRSDYYYSPDIITLAVIDLNTMQLADSECFLGASETLYASPNAVYLATTQWDYSNAPFIDFDAVADSIPYVDPRVDTDIHQFDIDGGQLTYNGSGVVTGHLGWNELRKPFRMSEKDGYLRVATLSDTQSPDVSPINVSVLQPDGNGALRLVSQLPNASQPAHIGKPGEQLYASRFLGDRAYLVTFRQTDPLYVIDLSDPANPSVAGELEIAGYSDYLQPIDENYLLGIGKDAVPAPDRWGDGRGALAQGVKLSLFNVSNPAAPTEVNSVVVGQRGTEATALYNHRAITIQAATENHPTRIAFGIDVAGRADPGQTPPSGENAGIWYPWNFTGLFGFEVRTGADAGVSSIGVMNVESASEGNFRYGPYAGDDRSIIFNDSVYYIHGADVYAAPWNTLSNNVGPR